MEADVYKAFLRQRQRQWHHRTRWQLTAHPRQFAAEEQQKFEEKAVKRSCTFNEQGSDGEEGSHEEQQRQADAEAKNMAAKQQQVQQTEHQILVAEEQRVQDNGVEMRTTKQDGDEDGFESHKSLSLEGNRISH